MLPTIWCDTQISSMPSIQGSLHLSTWALDQAFPQACLQCPDQEALVLVTCEVTYAGWEPRSLQSQFSVASLVLSFQVPPHLLSVWCNQSPVAAPCLLAHAWEFDSASAHGLARLWHAKDSPGKGKVALFARRFPCVESHSELSDYPASSWDYSRPVILKKHDNTSFRTTRLQQDCVWCITAKLLLCCKITWPFPLRSRIHLFFGTLKWTRKYH